MNAALSLVERLTAKAAQTERLQPPLGNDVLAAAESTLGFRLHPLLADLYLRVSNGGFGPGYSMLALTGDPNPGDEETVVEGYLDRIPPAGTDTWWTWPRGVLPILDWGCAMFACVDCLSPDGTVLLFDPNRISNKDLTRTWYLDNDSLAHWLELWLNGQGWYEPETTGSMSDLPPWSQAASRL